MKLTKKQKEIIELMRQGWEVALTYGINYSAWMQKGKIGFGGESITLRFDSVHSLLDKQIITDNGTAKRLSDKYYSLTELGKTIELK